MKSKERLVSYGIIVILIGIILYFFLVDKPNYVDYFNNKINELEVKIDSVSTLNDSLDFQIEKNILDLSKYSDSIQEKDNMIYDLNLKTNEKVNNVDSFSNDELNSFFTERYNKSSIKKRDSTISN